MFERYTENARRAIFFARYESSQFGAAEISVEHFLLGVLREDREFAARMPLTVIRERIEKNFPAKTKISTSVDLPLSAAMKRVLAFSAEAAESLGQNSIGTQHHLLGILREPSFAADLLREYGFDETVVTAGARPSAPQPKSAILEASVRDLHELIQSRADLTQVGTLIAEKQFDAAWKEAIGHLIDCAVAFHRWVAPALSGKPDVFELPPRGLLSEAYGNAPRRMLFDVWLSLNTLLLQILCEVREESAEAIAPVASAYVKHCGEAIPSRF